MMCGLEQWRWVVGYEGLYQVSDQGRVRSVDRVVKHYLGGPKKLKGKIIRAFPDKRYGHLSVRTANKGVTKTAAVHRLVAVAWFGPCPEGQQVRHGPNGVTDNSVANLSYGTPSQDGYDKRRDGTHGGWSVVRSDGVEFINLHVAAEETSCQYQNIWSCCDGRRKTAGGYGWRYMDG